MNIFRSRERRSWAGKVQAAGMRGSLRPRSHEEDYASILVWKETGKFQWVGIDTLSCSNDNHVLIEASMDISEIIFDNM